MFTDCMGAQERRKYHISQCLGVTARLFFLGRLSLYPNFTLTYVEGRGRRGGRVPSCETGISIPICRWRKGLTEKPPIY